MWEPLYAGIEPRPLHNGDVCSATGSQDVSWVPLSEPTHVVVTAWWWIHIPIQSIWRLPNACYMLGEGVGTIFCWLKASATANGAVCSPDGVRVRVRVKLPHITVNCFLVLPSRDLKNIVDMSEMLSINNFLDLQVNMECSLIRAPHGARAYPWIFIE
jgi:hypothetical protein